MYLIRFEIVHLNKQLSYQSNFILDRNLNPSALKPVEFRSVTLQRKHSKLRIFYEVLCSVPFHSFCKFILNFKWFAIV
jgi:hypothetical protein